MQEKWTPTFVSVLLLISLAKPIGSVGFLVALGVIANLYTIVQIGRDIHSLCVDSDTKLIRNQLVDISKAIGKIDDNV